MKPQTRKFTIGAKSRRLAASQVGALREIGDMADEGKVMSREEIEQAIKRLDQRINGLVEGILSAGAKPGYDPDSQSAQAAAGYLKDAREQKNLLVNYLKRIDSTDAF